MSILALSIALLFLVDLLSPFPFSTLTRQPATVVYDRNGTIIRIVLPSDEIYRMPVTIDDIPREMIEALITSEDRWFYIHPGVDPVAFARAMGTNVRARRIVSGASTIPMQIARMAEPKDRTLGSKAIEMFRALQLTKHYSKRELLEIYLNLAPYGGNVEGVGAASWFYFGKQPRQLSLGEIALLTALPRSPTRYDPIRSPDRAKQARDEVLHQLARRGMFARADVDKAIQQPVPRMRRTAPMVAPHFTDFAVARSGGAARIDTTLDRRVQRIAEEQVAARVTGLRRVGVENAAAVIIDNRTREVVAMVGSTGFFESDFDGQVNGAIARRSPGSTLKPFLYARAFDEGVLVPDSYVLDIPTDFSGYVAENYDGEYRGRVLVRDALVHSLNACAVRLLAQVGIDKFLEVLRRGGLRTLDRDGSAYGLPLILGSGEVTLLDLTNLYATLANGGLHREARIHPGPPQNGVRLFSPEAVGMITTILRDVRRPDMPQSWELTRGVPAVAWKTGTSYGHRDAWSVGYSKQYTIGVWVGNFDGRGQKGISGSEHAGPLLFDLFRALDGTGAPASDPASFDTFAPADIELIEVCALSRELPGPYCDHTITISYIPGVSRLQSCSIHRRIFVDRTTGERLLGACADSRPQSAEIVSVYPAELVAFWQAQNQQFETIPPLSSACTEVAGDGRPRIVSPAGTTPYRLRRDAPIEYQEISLAAQVPAGVERLYWYHDGVLIASTSPKRRAFIRPARGSHRVMVVDDTGRSDAVTYQVE